MWNLKGFTDKELESLSEIKLHERGSAPWISWESENSSFGKAFRTWALFPSFLPLCICSDHAVHWESRCWPNELESPYPFFTWNHKKHLTMLNEHRRRSYYVTHPWIFYRKKYFPNIASNGKKKGTLVFYAHSNDTTIPRYKNLDKYVSDLKQLPSKYQPIIFCLSFHDIKKGLHKKLRKYNIPLMTAGSTNSQQFVDRFYSLINRFRYTSSSNIGSHTYYIIEAGIPFFLFGPYPEYEAKNTTWISDGKVDFREYGDVNDIKKLETFKKMLRHRHDKPTKAQINYAESYLGINSKISRFHACSILWGSLLLNIRKVLLLYFNAIFSLIKFFIKKYIYR